MAKRIFDILAATAALAVLVPLFPIVAAAIKLDSRGPVFYRQLRVGRNGKAFRIFKLRSMADGADRLYPITLDADPRVTRVGGFLRRCKLDELPTLLNVVRGEMSIVGPRPELPLYVAGYSEEQRRVLSVQPGITDLGTLHFDSAEVKLLPASDDAGRVYSEEILPEKLRLNLEYIDNRSLWLDLRIIVMTLFVIVRRVAGAARHGAA